MPSFGFDNIFLLKFPFGVHIRGRQALYGLKTITCSRDQSLRNLAFSFVRSCAQNYENAIKSILTVF